MLFSGVPPYCLADTSVKHKLFLSDNYQFAHGADLVIRAAPCFLLILQLAATIQP